MQFVNYFLSSLICFLGLLIGIVLVKIAPEEQKPLKRKFFLARRIILILIFGSAVYYYSANPPYLLILILLFFGVFFVESKIGDIKKTTMIDYAILGAVLSISSKSSAVFAATSCLILIYGMVISSILYKIGKKNHMDLMLKNAVFFISSSIIYLII